MDDTLRLILIYGVLPAVVGIGTFIVKSILTRIEVLEKQLPAKVEEPDVRQLLDDKIDPIKENISEIKSTLNKIMDLLIKK